MPRTGFWLLLTAAAVGLAGCAGPSSPPAARPGHGSSHPAAARSTPVTTVPEHDPSRLLAEWGNCMRHHGDPNQADPTINAGQAIQVVQPAGYLGTIYGASGNSSSGAGVVCQAYLSAASAALRGGRPLPSVSLAAGDRYAACMRTHGVPSFPDFSGIRPGSPGSGGGPGSNGPFDPSSPIFERAAAACDKETGSHMPTLNGSVTLPGEIEFSFAGGPVTSIEF